MTSKYKAKLIIICINIYIFISASLLPRDNRVCFVCLFVFAAAKCSNYNNKKKEEEKEEETKKKKISREQQ